MAYIKKEPIIEFITKGLNNPNKTKAFGYDAIEILAEIEYAPTADVVEVVRCKDCIHWGGVTHGFVCRKFSGIDTKICMGADHFCSYGENALKEREKE